MVAGAISKLPVLEFSIAVLNDLDADFFAEKTIQGFGLGCATGKNNGRAIVFHGIRTDRVLDAVVQAGQCKVLRAYLGVTRCGDEREDH